MNRWLRILALAAMLAFLAASFWFDDNNLPDSTGQVGE